MISASNRVPIQKFQYKLTSSYYSCGINGLLILHITYLNKKVNFPIFSNISRNCKLGTARLGSMYSFHRC
ncbi:hypothetical protein T08_285 [Trichinella sp. T8]|nr:hypothetical protein T08_285 [Trichinella sp. T8]